MSEKLNKKTIIAIAVIIVLVIAAITGTIAFLKNKGTSEAAEISTNKEEQSQNQKQDGSNTEIANQTENTDNQNGNEISQSENSEQIGNETTNQEETNTTNGEVVENNQIENAEATENNQIQNAGTTANNQAQGTTANNQGAQNANNQNAGVDEIQGTTITRVEEIRDRKVSDDRDIGWTPIAISAEMASAKINAEKSDIEVHKYVSTKTGINLVREEEEVTYTIHVKNNSKETLNNIEVTDKIPEKTTYVETDDNAQQIKNENGEVIGLKWYINIAPDEVVGIQFKVKVNVDEIGTVLNTAIANGENSEEVQTAIIKQEKSYIVTRNVNDEETEVEAPVKVGDKITFTISVKNTGDIDGTTTIKDADLEQILADNKAEMVGNVIIYNGEEIVSSEKTAQDLINGIENVTIPAQGTAKVEFTVKVNKIVEKIINEAIVGDEEQKPTNEVVIDTLNLDIVKDVKEIIRNNEKVEGPAKVDDIIYYDIKVKNTGTVEKEAKVEDILENNNLDIDVYYNNEIVTKITLMPGEEKLLTASYVVTQEDVDNQTDLRNVAKIIYDNEEKQDDAITPVVEADPAIKIIKTAIKVNGIEVETDENENVITKVRKDDIVTFSIKVINTGNITLNDVKVTDDLKVNYNGTEFEPGKTIKTIATLAPNAEDTFEVTYEVTSEDMNLTKIINIATAKAIVEDKKSDDEDLEDGTVEEPENPENPQDPQEPVNPPKTYEISDSDDAEVPINPNVSVSGTKIWEDENNRDGIRPDNITIKLVSSDETDTKERTTTIGKKQDGTYDWTYTFENLSKYDSERNIIAYTVTETGIDTNKYSVSYSDPQVDEAGNTVIDITNAHEIERVIVKGEKTWEDENNRDNKRPGSIDVQIYAGETAGEVKNVTPDENGDWKYEFTGLPKYEEGKQGVEIEYSVKEVEVPDGYVSNSEEVTIDKQTGDIIADITNTHEIETVTIKGEKTWEDENNRDNKRPENIDVQIYAGEIAGEVKNVTPDENGIWKYEFTNLPKYEEGKQGQAIEYSVKEVETPDGYISNQLDVTIDEQTGDIIANITNVHEIETVTVKGQKIWIDDSNRDNIRPSSINVQLYVGETAGEVKNVTPDENGDWKYEFAGLPKYEEGKQGVEIEYSVKEVEEPEGYTQSLVDVTTDENTGDIISDITNTHEIETVAVKGEKTWEDTWNENENAYGVRPPSITVNLNKKVGESGTATLVSGKTATVVPDANGDWKYEFTNLPKYENGVEIEYSVTESTVENYTPSYDDVTIDEETGDIIANITNTINESEASTVVQVIKNGIEQRDIPVDVVFVVDRSASMVNNKTNGITRAENMISALNNCMQTVLESNADNRVAVAAFSDSADIILPLGHYTKSNGKYFTYNSSKTNDFRCNVSGGTNTKFEGGTYTQLGIRTGAEELMNKIGNNDKNRTPIIILITDGLPTYYAESLTPTKSNRLGDSICEKPEEGAYTILTAKYYKTQLTNKYKNDTIFLTVGIDLTNNQYATTILNPTKDNIKACEDNTQYLKDSLNRYPADPNNGTLTNRFYAAKNLYLALTGQSFDTLQEYGNNGKYKLVAGTAMNTEHLTTVGASTSNLDSYSYATGTLSATNSSQLISDLKDLLTDSYPSSDEVEATAERADLPDIDITKAFKIVAKKGTTVKVEYKGTNAFSDALAGGVVVQESNGNYYVNLKHPKFYNCTEISIEYNSK